MKLQVLLRNVDLTISKLFFIACLWLSFKTTSIEDMAEKNKKQIVYYSISTTSFPNRITSINFDVTDKNLIDRSTKIKTYDKVSTASIRRIAVGIYGENIILKKQ